MSETTLEERPAQPSGSPRTSADPPYEDPQGRYWRSEILQAMYWLTTEGFGDRIDAALLERFLGADAAVGVQYLDRLVEEGSIESAGGRYSLSAAGARRGETEFAASFEELVRPTSCSCTLAREPGGDTP